jgi:hypothetical protein
MVYTPTNMTIKEIIENIVELASEDMTEDGIHHDEWPDREFEYTDKIVRQLIEHFEPFDVMEALNGLTIRKK